MSWGGAGRIWFRDLQSDKFGIRCPKTWDGDLDKTTVLRSLLHW